MLDLELTITSTGGQTSAALHVELPSRRVGLADSLPLRIDTVALRAMSLMPDDYGAALSRMVFVSALREAWQRALGYAEGQSAPLRVRLHLRGDDALHAIRWELLHDPVSNTPLAYRERVAFSRFLSSDYLGETPPFPPQQLRVLVAVADAAGAGMAPVDVAGEVRRAQLGLGDLPVTVLDGREGRPAATLANLADALRAGPHMLLLTCHGTLRDGQPYLYLAGDDPYRPTPGADVVRQVADLRQRPLLLILASCLGAGDSYATLAALGPHMARIGIGAVIAMQGNVPMKLVAALMPRLFTELRRDGQIDRALAAARAALPAEQPWWQPVLWMAVKDGALWRRAATTERGAGVFQVPYPPNPHFRGRDDELAKLAEALLGETSGPVALLPAVSGTGGIGKTQLASEFAHAYASHFPGGIFWLNMADGATIKSQVAAAGGPEGLDLPGWSGLPFAEKIAAVKRAWSEPVRRLLIFDNLEEPALLAAWRPTIGGARVLITTRRGVWAASSGVRPIPLQTLARAASLRLLLAPRHGDQGETVLADPATAQAADAICEQVGDLPLALALAGAYLEQTPSLSLAGYSSRLAAMLLKHPSLDAELEEGLPTQHATSVAATIALSYERLEPTKASDALALTLLQRMAQLAPAPIPQRLLVRLAERNPDDEDQAAEVDAPLRRLAALGLVELLDAGAASMHRLVAAFVQDQDNNAEANLARVTAKLIKEVFKINDSGYPQRGQAYLPHLNALINSEGCLGLKQKAKLRNSLGYLLRAQGDLLGAQLHYERALAIKEEVFGPDHIATARSLNNLGYVLRAKGDLVRARTCIERSLMIKERVRGADHIATARTRNNLGAILQAQGDLIGARAYIEQSLAIRERVHDPQHRAIARSLNNLGDVLKTLGDLAGAQHCYHRALAIRDQVLGSDHPATAQSLNDLGMLLCAQGELTEAQSYVERALAIREQALGPMHPDTALSLNNLGGLLQAQGDLAGAKPYVERALAIFMARLGPKHPDTQLVRRNLAALDEAV